MFSTPRHRSEKTKYIVMMTKEGATKIVNFMTPGAGVLEIGQGHMSYCENALFLLKSSFLLPGIDQTNYQ